MPMLRRSTVRSVGGSIFAIVVLVIGVAIAAALLGINIPGLNIISSALGF
ncbi:MAG: hypothetical protein AMXMBFR84_11820 [Candidatus Hydrogenedentota bacterium]